MKNLVGDLVDRRPDMQFSRESAHSKMFSLFGNTNSFAVGMGLGNKFGSRPVFHRKNMQFGQAAWMAHRKGG